jgi:predicted dehydrogenase
MATFHASAAAKLKGCKMVAACDVDEAQVHAFCDKYDIPRAWTDYDAMLDAGGFDVVVNATPDRFHAPLTLKAIRKGYHVLCEKPLAETYADAAKMARAAKRAGVINMVNMSYRNSAALQKVAQLARSGKLGALRHVEASYAQSWLVADYWGNWSKNPGLLWRLSSRHGSKGVLGDIGVHIVDFASLPAGDVRSVHCRFQTFPKIAGKGFVSGKYGEYVLDANDSAAITLEFKNGALGVVHTTRWGTGYRNALKLHVHGTKGAIRLDLDKSSDEFEICSGKDIETCSWKTVKAPATPPIWERFVKSIRTGKNDQPDFARGAAVQKILDACFESDSTDRTVKV